jgi:hypothetical protein
MRAKRGTPLYCRMAGRRTPALARPGKKTLDQALDEGTRQLAESKAERPDTMLQ